MAEMRLESLLELPVKLLEKPSKDTPAHQNWQHQIDHFQCGDVGGRNARSGRAGSGRIATETGNAPPTSFPNAPKRKYVVRTDPSRRLEPLVELPTKHLEKTFQRAPTPPKPAAPNRPLSVGAYERPKCPVGFGQAGLDRDGNGARATDPLPNAPEKKVRRSGRPFTPLRVPCRAPDEILGKAFRRQPKPTKTGGTRSTISLGACGWSKCPVGSDKVGPGGDGNGKCALDPLPNAPTGKIRCTDRPFAPIRVPCRTPCETP